MHHACRLSPPKARVWPRLWLRIAWPSGAEDGFLLLSLLSSLIAVPDVRRRRMLAAQKRCRRCRMSRRSNARWEGLTEKV